MDSSRNFRQRQATQNFRDFSLEETYLLCVDPQTLRPFKLSIGSYGVIMENKQPIKSDENREDKKQEDLSPQLKLQQENSLKVGQSSVKEFNNNLEEENLRCIENKIKRHVFIMQDLMTLDNTPDGIKWALETKHIALDARPVRKESNDDENIQSDYMDIESYRRQMVQPYLLHEEQHKYPRYVNQSDLPNKNLKNPNEDILIYLKIWIAEDILTRPKSFFHKNRGKSSSQNQKTFLDMHEVFLLDTANKIIRKVQKKIDKMLDFDIKEKQNNYILKFKNIESYIYGKEQLIYFQEVRDFLRKSKSAGGDKKPLELVVLIIENDSQQCNFPPLYNRRFEEDFKRPFSRRNSSRNTQFLAGDVTSKKSQTFANEKQSFKQENESRMSDQLRMTSLGMKTFGNKKNSSTDVDQVTEKYKDESIFFWYLPNGSQKQNYSSVDSLNMIFYPFNSKITLSPLQNNYFTNNAQPINNDDHFLSSQICDIFTLQVYGIRDIVTKLKLLLENHQQKQKFNQKQNSDSKCKKKLKNQQLIIEIDQVIIDQIFPDLMVNQSQVSLRSIKTLQNNSQTNKSLIQGYSINDNSKQPFEQAQKQQDAFIDNNDLIQRPSLVKSKTINVDGIRRATINSRNKSENREVKQVPQTLGFKELSSNTMQQFQVGCNLNQDQKQVIHYSLRSNHTSHKKSKVKSFSIDFKSIIVQAQLYLGNKPLSEFAYTKFETYQDNVLLQDVIRFKKIGNHKSKNASFIHKNENYIKIQDLPSYTRICFNLLSFEQEKYQVKLRNIKAFILGSASVSLFDYNKMMKSGRVSINLWPFQKYDPRVVCQGECRVQDQNFMNENNLSQQISLQIGFPRYERKIQWALKQETITAYQQAIIETQIFESFLDLNEDSPEHQLGFQSEHKRSIRNPYVVSSHYENGNQGGGNIIDQDGFNLREVKKMLDKYPLEEKNTKKYTYNPELIIKNKKYVDILPSFVKAVDFTNQDQLIVCYNYLDKSQRAKDLKPEEALALLDSKFGDEKVRLFAVQKLTELDDYTIALYMPQLIQALKSELYHQSYLSEFLLERAIRNTGVIGHTFFWTLKASLHDSKSFERFYLIMERFLMCCGRFKFTLYNQNLMNKALKEVSHFQQTYRDSIKHENFIANSKRQIEIMNTLLQLKQLEIKEKIIYVLRNEQQEFSQSIIQEISERYENKFEQIRKRQNEIPKHDKSNPIKLSDFIHDVPNMVGEEIDFYFPLEPKKPIKQLSDGENRFFSSKKLPMMLTAILRSDQICENADISRDIPSNLDGQPKQSNNQLSQILPNAPRLPSLKQNQSQLEQQKLKIIFKYGDDLRQDNLVLQIFKLMDKLWVEQDLNLEMLAYNIFEIGYQMGYLELVDQSLEYAEIYEKMGNHSPFKDDTLYRYVNTLWQNETQNIIIERPHYLQNFIKSLASQVVASYILSIGDRHCGNYMFQKYTGKFFHIDFGHFMGHKKKFLFFEVEKEPFIYQKQFNYFIQNFKTVGFERSDTIHELNTQQNLDNSVQDYQKSQNTQQGQDNHKKLEDKEFNKKSAKHGHSSSQVSSSKSRKQKKHDKIQEIEKYCCEAFKILRQNSHTLINLLMLMVVSGIDQLTEDGIMQMTQRLKLKVSDEEAENEFKKQIQMALGIHRRKITDYLHVGKHQHKRNVCTNLFRCCCMCCH
eukprot:403336721